MGGDEIDRVLEALPGFDCLECGMTCRELAERIAGGRATREDCIPLTDETVELLINGQRIPLTEFPRRFLEGTVIGAVSALKGVEPVRSLQLRIVHDPADRG